MNPKKLLFCLVTIIHLQSWSHAQNPTEFLIHLQSIDTSIYINNKNDGDSSNTNRNFVNTVIKHNLHSPSDKYFISNRRLLDRLQTSRCDSQVVEMQQRSKNGDLWTIHFNQKIFDKSKHRIAGNKQLDHIRSIDGRFPYGGVFQLPRLQVDQLSILVNGKPVSIPAAAYSDLYNIVGCDSSYSSEERFAAYWSLDHEYLYLYFYGGSNAGLYWTKMIFNKTTYITRIIADYDQLSQHAAFGPKFIGF